MGHKPWENWARLICCLQDLTIHHKDLHINVPVQLCTPDHVYYNEIQLNYLIKIKKSNISNRKITIVIRNFAKDVIINILLLANEIFLR